MIRGLLTAIAATLLLAPTAGAQNVRGQLEKLKQEPSVREVQEAALRYFKVNQNTVASMRSRAGAKAAVPVVQVSGGFARSEQDEDTENYQVFSDGSPWIVKGASGNSWDVRGKLTWDLPRLVFNAEELDVASLAGLMEGILKESTRLYFMRRRLQVDMVLTPPTDQATLLSKELRLEELTALIDAMTGGWFSDELARRGGQAKAAPATQAPAHAAALRTIPEGLRATSGSVKGAKTILRVRKAAAPGR